MSVLTECRDALASPNVQAFLRVIRAGETGQGDDAYRTIVGGGHFDSFDDHPRRLVRIERLNLSSTAAGAYQFLSRTWDECRDALSLPDFSPPMQDLAAVFLIRRRTALADVLAGDIHNALAKCGREWASLPGSPYGQPTRTVAQALATYKQFGGALATDAAPAPAQAPSAPISPPPAPSPSPSYMPAGEIIPEEPTMVPALIPIALDAIGKLLPSFAATFGSGSEMQQRNAKAAEMAITVAKDAIGAVNEQDLVEKVERDPEAAAAVKTAVKASMGDLVGLMIQAGEADEKSRAAALDRNVALGKATGGKWLWLLGGIAAMVVLVSYLITAGVLFSEKTTFSDETKALLLGQIVIFGFVTVLAFLFGSNIQNRISQRDQAQRGE